MGSNYADFLKEANRVLKKNGKLMVAEVTSRLEDPQKFCKLMKSQCGFKVLKLNKLKDYFYLMVFEKIGKSKKEIDPELNTLLKPCIYKRR